MVWIHGPTTTQDLKWTVGLQAGCSLQCLMSCWIFSSSTSSSSSLRGVERVVAVGRETPFLVAPLPLVASGKGTAAAAVRTEDFSSVFPSSSSGFCGSSCSTAAVVALLEEESANKRCLLVVWNSRFCFLWNHSAEDPPQAQEVAPAAAADDDDPPDDKDERWLRRGRPARTARRVKKNA